MLVREPVRGNLPWLIVVHKFDLKVAEELSGEFVQFKLTVSQYSSL